MTDTHCKKSIIKMLGIEELISEYEDHCGKMNARKKNISSSQIRNRYSSLLDIENKKQSTHTSANIYQNFATTKYNSYAKTATNKSFELSHKQNTIQSEVNNNKNTKNTSEMHYKKPKIISSLANFNNKKTSPTSQQNISKKVSLKLNEFTHQSINILSEANIKLTPKQSNKYSSYLSLKARNSQKVKQSSKLQIDFENPTLAGINKKIKEFEKKGIKKQENSNIFKKNLKTKQSEQQINSDKLNDKKMSETISFQPENRKEKQQYISIDTNYYGFSFKNKVSFKPCKSELKKESCQQIASTLDKSTNQNALLHSNQDSEMKKISKSTSKIPPATGRRTYNTLNTQKKDRYNSTNALKKKKPHSSLVLKPKSILKDRYQIIKVIGRGMSGEVFQAKDVLSDRFVAIKQIDENCIEYDFFREITHQNVIRYYNNFVQNGKRYLVLEYFPMTLKDLLKDSRKQIQLTETDVKHIFKGILNGLSYLHSLSIAHRDIKLDNIVISEDLSEVKFIDFGLCIDLCKIQEGLSKDFCGTLSYLPPQIVQGQSHEPKKADISSLGIVLYAISVGRLPFKGKNQCEILTKICKGRPIYPQGFNSQLKELIQFMLEKNPVKRWSVNQILSHQWLH